jgi:phosphate transport system ATP-binding protein
MESLMEKQLKENLKEKEAQMPEPQTNKIAAAPGLDVALRIENLSAGYGSGMTLKNINMSIFEKNITAIIGPSGCGKSTLVRCMNRMHEVYPGATYDGGIYVGGQNIFNMDPVVLRTQVGMVFQRPNPFPTMTIFQNVAAGLLLGGKMAKSELAEIVETSLTQAALWEEVKDKLNQPALNLSGGQQQRLCIARALAVKPKVLLLDEPCSALDPIATARIEELLLELKKNLTIVIVTHNMQQAARASDYTGFMLLGDLVEFDVTGKIFTNPRDSRTLDYVTGRFG